MRPAGLGQDRHCLTDLSHQILSDGLCRELSGGATDTHLARVDHSHSAADLTEIGKDLEALALARAVAAHAEHRVMVNGNKTVVFRR